MIMYNFGSEGGRVQPRAVILFTILRVYVKVERAVGKTEKLKILKFQSSK